MSDEDGQRCVWLEEFKPCSCDRCIEVMEWWRRKLGNITFFNKKFPKA